MIATLEYNLNNKTLINFGTSTTRASIGTRAYSKHLELNISELISY